MNLRVIAAFAAAVVALPAFAQTPIDQLAKPPADAKIWTITSGDGTVPHGQIALWTDTQGTHWSRESLNLRGIVTEIDEQNRYAPDGSIVSFVIRGSVPEGDAAETYEVKDGVYTFKSPVDHGTGKVAPTLQYVTFGGTFDSFVPLIDAMMKAPNHTIDLLPSGRGRMEPLTTLEVSNGSEKKTLTAYAMTGFGLSPFPIWMDGDKLFGIAGVLSFLPKGWEKNAPVMSKVQDAALAKQAPALTAAIAKTPAGAVVFRNVKLYDSEARTFRDGMTVVVENGKITMVGQGLMVKMPASARVIDGTGKTLVPGLWDNHQHYSDDWNGPLLLASGITSVRDPGNRRDRRHGSQEAHRQRRAARPAHRAVAADRRRRPLHRTGWRHRAQSRRSAGRCAPRQGRRLFRHQALRHDRTVLGEANGDAGASAGVARARSYPAWHASARRRA